MIKRGVMGGVVLLAVALVACDGTSYSGTANERATNIDPNNDVNNDFPNNDANNDVNNDDRPTVEPAREITFVIENGGNLPIYLQTANYSGHPTWFRVMGGDQRRELRVMGDCGICDCAEGNQCAVCGEVFPMVADLLPGQTFSWTWEGLEYVIDNGGPLGQCERPEVVAGDRFTVELCWGDTFVNTDEGNWVEEARCEAVDFVLGEDDEARVVTPRGLAPDEAIVGWYTESFEHSGFKPGLEPPVDLESCQPDGALESTWWYTGPRPETRSLTTGTPIGLLAVEGSVSEPGDFGHLGAYERELTAQGAELLLCEMAASLRSCVVPQIGDSCLLIPDLDNSPALDRRYRLVRASVDVLDPDGNAFVEVSVIHDHPDWDDEEWGLEVSFSIPVNAGRVSLDGLRDARMAFVIFGAEVQRQELPLIGGFAELDFEGAVLRLNLESAFGQQPLHLFLGHPLAE